MQAPPTPSADDLTPAARDNIDRLAEFQDREEAEVSPIQAAIEAISGFFGSPAYFVFVLAFITCWIAINAWGEEAGWDHVDAFPYFALQGIVSANALLLTIAVLIRQNRMSKQATRRAHLDLHVNLLTEQKVSKVLQVVDELRTSMGHPTVHDDAQTKELARGC